MPAQITQTVGGNPNPPTTRQASVPSDNSINYRSESPEGEDPYTLGLQY